MKRLATLRELLCLRSQPHFQWWLPSGEDVRLEDSVREQAGAMRQTGYPKGRKGYVVDHHPAARCALLMRTCHPLCDGASTINCFPRRWKRRIQTRSFLRITAPALDPNR